VNDGFSIYGLLLSYAGMPSISNGILLALDITQTAQLAFLRAGVLWRECLANTLLLANHEHRFILVLCP
jgi:hypothetical protein